jgi:cytochrome b561
MGARAMDSKAATPTQTKRTRDRYTGVAIALHWLIALLLVGQIAVGLLMVRIPDNQPALTFEVYQLHKSFGITILALTLARIVWRLINPVPPLPAAMPALERVAARAVHVGFYVLLVVTPLLGWAYVSIAPLNVPTMLFGQIHLPHLPFFEGVADRKALADTLEEAHEIAAKSFIALLVLHVGAALKHHFLDRDDVLSRMLPLVRPRSRS